MLDIDNKYFKIIGVIISIPILLVVLLVVFNVKEYNKAEAYGERIQAQIINKYSEEGETRQDQQKVIMGNGQFITIPITTKDRDSFLLTLRVKGKEYEMKRTYIEWEKDKVGDSINVIEYEGKIYLDKNRGNEE